MSKKESAQIVAAEPGWHVVRIKRTAKSDGAGIAIDCIQKITHWSKSTGHPMQDGKQLYFDPDDISHVLYVSFVMDPQGRLLGRNRKLIANSVFDLYEWHKAERAAQERRVAAAANSDAGRYGAAQAAITTLPPQGYGPPLPVRCSGPLARCMWLSPA